MNPNRVIEERDHVGELEEAEPPRTRMKLGI
ncbi:MAG: hypothetical protein K0S65_3990 [Labilithrix sp.]|nr:hypothetical protein [Labilithrix sp.]